MISNAVGYYLRPTVWAIDAPTQSADDIDPRSLDEKVLRDVLQCGIVIGVQRQGLFIFDFTNWPPGRAIGDESTAVAFDEIARVQLSRVEVLNAHLACLYSAISNLQNFCLDKMSAVPDDLIYKKSIDDSGMSFGNPIVGALALAPFRSTYQTGVPRSFDWRLATRGGQRRGQIRSWLFRVDSEKSRFRKSEFLFGPAASNPERKTRLRYGSEKGLCVFIPWRLRRGRLAHFQEIWYTLPTGGGTIFFRVNSSLRRSRCRIVSAE